MSIPVASGVTGIEEDGVAVDHGVDPLAVPEVNVEIHGA